VGTGHLDESASAALDCGHGSDHLHRLDLRSSEAARSGSESRASADVAAIAASTQKNDRVGSGKLADCLRCDFLPECYMASTEIRERRRTLRYRNLLVRQAVQLKNRVSILLMETGVTYNKQQLHRAGYFHELLARMRSTKVSDRFCG